MARSRSAERGFVLDASACMAWFHKERGSNVVHRALMGRCHLSAVTLSELYALADQPGRLNRSDWRLLLEGLRVNVEPFGEEDAQVVGPLWKYAGGKQRPLGGFADRAAFGLAKRLGLAALTTEAKWKSAGEAEGVTVRVLTDRQP